MRWPGGRWRTRFPVAAVSVTVLVTLCVASLDHRQEVTRHVVTIHHQQTIATVLQNGRGNVTHCRIIEVKFPDEELAAIRELSLLQKVNNVSLEEMLETLKVCEQLDLQRARDGTGLQEDDHDQQWMTQALLRGIVPGTKWCGLGDQADGWNDLGSNIALDVCCRTHDLCPVKVVAYRQRYGLFNWSPYTKSHCACDEEFYSCLKRSGSRLAETVGRIYFDVLRASCVQGRVCEQLDPLCRLQQRHEGPLRFQRPGQQFDPPPPGSSRSGRWLQLLQPSSWLQADDVAAVGAPSRRMSPPPLS